MSLSLCWQDPLSNTEYGHAGPVPALVQCYTQKRLDAATPRLDIWTDPVRTVDTADIALLLSRMPRSPRRLCLHGDETAMSAMLAAIAGGTLKGFETLEVRPNFGRELFGESLHWTPRWVELLEATAIARTEFTHLKTTGDTQAVVFDLLRTLGVRVTT